MISSVTVLFRFWNNNELIYESLIPILYNNTIQMKQLNIYLDYRITLRIFPDIQISIKVETYGHTLIPNNNLHMLFYANAKQSINTNHTHINCDCELHDYH